MSNGRKIKPPPGVQPPIAEQPGTVVGPLADFSIGIESRFSKSAGSYSRKTQKYDANYVTPKAWRVRLSARAALAKQTGIQFAPNPPTSDPFQDFLIRGVNSILDNPGQINLPEPIPTPPLKLPDNVLAYEWSIQKLGGGIFRRLL